MRSGTSYFNLTVFRKHLTRFWPIWTAWLVVLLLMLPVRGLMALREDGAGMEGRLAWFARSIPDLTSSGFTLVMAVLVGLLAAMAACSHLYSTRSANFMGALPVRREGLFFSHYLAGLVMVLGPVLAASLLTLLVELAGGALELLPLGYWLGYACSAGFFFYSFAVFLGMFTGHLLALPAFYLIFNFLVMAVVGLVEWALRSFYYGFGSLPDWLYDGMQWCTPVMRYTYVQLVGRPQELFYGTTLWVYPIVAAVLAGAALLLYRRRSLEAAGDVVAVRAMRPVFQYGVALCAGLFLGMVTAQLLGLPDLGLMAAILLWGVAGYFVARMLLDKSFRVWGHWKGAAVTAAVLLVLFAVVGFDLTGFETRVPRAEDVASVKVSGLQVWPSDGGNNVNVTLEDPEEIAAVIALHQAVVDRKDRAGATDGSDYYGGAYFDISYSMKDGATLARRYNYVLVDQELDQLGQAVINDPDVIPQIYGFDRMEEEIGPVFMALWQGQVVGYGDQAQQILDAVKEDIQAGRLGHHSLIYGGMELPWLELEWRTYAPGAGENDGYSDSEVISIAVPDTATSTLAVLEELTAETEE